MLQQKIKDDHLGQLRASVMEKKNTLRDTDGSSANTVPKFHKTGLFQAIATDVRFENTTLGVICLNAIWLAVDADHNDAELLINADWPFQVMEHFFCTFFTVEVSIRFVSYRRKYLCLTDAWFVFDAILVFLMVIETWLLTIVMSASGSTTGLGSASVMRLIRLLRLARMARVLRLLRALPELLILVKGMASATRSVAYALCLLVALLYIFSIIFVQLSTGTPLKAMYFTSVPKSMYVLMKHGAFLDGMGDFLDDLGEESGVQAAIFLLFVLFSALMVMNLVIGVLCEVVSAVSATEQEAMRIDSAKDVIRTHIHEMDENGDNVISKSEFLSVVDSKDLVFALQEIGLCAVTLVDVADEIFAEGSLTVEDFMERILLFRCTQPATLKDIVDLRYHITAIAEGKVAQEDGRLVQDLQNGNACHTGCTEHAAGMWDVPGVPLTELNYYAGNGPGVKHVEVTRVECIESVVSPLSSPQELPPSPPQASGVCWERDLQARLDLLTNAVFSMRTEFRESVADLKDRTGRIESALQAKGPL